MLPVSAISVDVQPKGAATRRARVGVRVATTVRSEVYFLISCSGD